MYATCKRDLQEAALLPPQLASRAAPLPVRLQPSTMARSTHTARPARWALGACLAAAACGRAAAVYNSVVVQLTASATASMETDLTANAQAALVSFLTTALDAPSGALLGANCVSNALLTFHVVDTSGKLPSLMATLGQALTASGNQWSSGITLDMILNAGPRAPSATASCFTAPPPAPSPPPAPTCGIAQGGLNSALLQFLDPATRP
jgi:hypothetical protein